MCLLTFIYVFTLSYHSLRVSLRHHRRSTLFFKNQNFHVHQTMKKVLSRRGRKSTSCNFHHFQQTCTVSRRVDYLSHTSFILSSNSLRLFLEKIDVRPGFITQDLLVHQTMRKVLSKRDRKIIPSNFYQYKGLR